MGSRETSEANKARIESLFRAFQAHVDLDQLERDVPIEPERADTLQLLRSDQRWLDETEAAWYCQCLPYRNAGFKDAVYLLPGILASWSRIILSDDDQCSLPENLTPAFSKTRLPSEHLSPDQVCAVYAFMRSAILERIAQESSLRIDGYGRSHRWVAHFAAYGVIAEDIPALWNEWWAMKELGHAIACVQYTSCLVCPDDMNPIFSPWTKEAGGGVPQLWAFESVGFKERWLPANVDFLKATLSPGYLRQTLDQAKACLTDAEQHDVIDRLIASMNESEELVAIRCEKLPMLLAIPSEVGSFEWETVGAW